MEDRTSVRHDLDRTLHLPRSHSTGRRRTDRSEAPRIEFDWRALQAYLRTVAPEWLADFLTVESDWSRVVRFQVYTRMALECPGGPDLPRVEALVLAAVDPGEYVPWDELSEYGRRLDVVADAIAQLAQRGRAADAVRIGGLALERIDAGADRVQDDGMVVLHRDAIEREVALVRERISDRGARSASDS